MTAGAIAVPTIMPLRAPIPGQHKTCIDTNTKVELHSDTPHVTIYYTVNGKKPEPFQTHGPAAKNTFKYREPIRLPGGKVTVKAIAVSEDGMRESHICTKAFDVEQLEHEPARMGDDDLNFMNDIPAQEIARKDVKRFQHNMVTSKEAWAEIQKLKDTEDMMREMSMVGSTRRKPGTGPHYLNSRMAASDKVTIGGETALVRNVEACSGGTVNGLNSVNGMSEAEAWRNKRTPPDNATQALRLQRETDFLKCIYCFAPRPADPFARFCNDCGNPVPPLPQGRMPPPEAGQMGTCIECKTLVPFNTLKCLICDADIPSQNVPQASLRLADKQLCIECGTPNPSTLDSCITCETRLQGRIKPLFHGSSAPAIPKGEGRLLTCTKCGRVNSSDARFCDWCGAKPTAPACNLVCSKCNANNNPYSGFCGSCGVRLEPPQRPDVRNSGLAVSINPSTFERTGQAQWLPLSLPVNPVAKSDMATQTVGLFFPSQKEIDKKQLDEEEKLALEKQMRDRKPLMTAVSPGRGYWRKQMDHICAHLKAHAQNNAEFRALIGEPRMGKIVSATVHEDGYELSLTVNLALRSNKEPFTSKKMYHSDYLSSYTRNSSQYASQDSLASGVSTARSTGRKSSARTKRSARKVKRKPLKTDAEDDKLSTEDRQLLKEVGKSGNGRPSDVQQLIEEGADPSCVNKDGIPALHLAVLNKHIDAIPVLVQEGANVNVRGSGRGNTALHEAVSLGSSGLDVIDTLLGLGASTQRKNNKGETAYDLAIKAGYENIANKFTASVGQTALDKLIRPRGTVTADVF